jgi:cell shape-determining protein MreC
MPLFNGLSSFSSFVFRPVLVLQNKISNNFDKLNTVFMFKNSLKKQNEELQLKLMENNAFLTNYYSIVDENIQLKEILGRKKEKINFLLSAILSKPNQSPYDTLIIDVGTKDGVKAGDLVFALGDVPIGYITTTHTNSSKVSLLSSSGNMTEVTIVGRNILMQLVGRGGGNFELILPRDFAIEAKSAVILPGIPSYVVATVLSTISDPRDSFTKALLISPVNVQELKFVQVKLSQ